MQLDPGQPAPPTFAPLMEVELRLVAAEVIWVPELLGAAASNVSGAHAQHRLQWTLSCCRRRLLSESHGEQMPHYDHGRQRFGCWRHAPRLDVASGQIIRAVQHLRS